MHESTAVLAFLPAPLKLKQPLLVAIKFWPDGPVEAHFVDALLFGTGEDEITALDDLRENMLSAWFRLSKTPHASLARPASRMWQALDATCEEVVSEKNLGLATV